MSLRISSLSPFGLSNSMGCDWGLAPLLAPRRWCWWVSSAVGTSGILWNSMSPGMSFLGGFVRVVRVGVRFGGVMLSRTCAVHALRSMASQ
jgi:hypothetical protein